MDDEKHSPKSSITVDAESEVLELAKARNELFDIMQEANMDAARYLRADDPMSRFMWRTIIIIFVIFAFIQIYYQIMLFASGPVTTNIEMEYPSTIAFPTVAICNNNQIRFRFPATICLWCYIDSFLSRGRVQPEIDVRKLRTKVI
ncbi:hypothetical protein Y032_0176g563 [Ancylostoma ceylanicum]|uniref:Amiloride-sensitive sodium channel n=1 Tax=Ancylostoma ceylanicum TaxID=53326 RepID=A0A016SUT7_9BILA|nr:hypothetical protein Y032_0176g563 [Ancylostoma ceylanicum]